MSNSTLTNQFSQEVFNFTQKFNPYLSKPQQGNLREIVRGTMLSESIYLNRIGKVNNTGAKDRKTIERLSNTLKKIDTEIFSQIHINSQINKDKEEPVLLFCDGGDIQKPYAKKMEKVCNTADGSNGHKPGKGYPTIGIMAYGTETKRLMPLAHHLYSTKNEDFKSEWDEHKKIFEQCAGFVQNSIKDRIIIEDRGGDDEKRFLYYLEEMGTSFVTRINTGNKSRNVIIKDTNGDETIISIHDLGKKLKKEAGNSKTWYNKKTNKKLRSKIIWQKVFLPTRKGTPLYAVFVFTTKYKDPLVVLTDLITEDAEQAWKYFFYYKKRWEVENFFRATKQNFSIENFLIRDFDKIKALVFIAMIVFALLLTLKQKIKEFLGWIYQEFIFFCKRKQDSGEHHLDLLAFLRSSLSNPPPEYSYRFWSREIRKRRLGTCKFQLKLLDFRKKW